jgi:predicted transcriptional regulator
MQRDDREQVLRARNERRQERLPRVTPEELDALRADICQAIRDHEIICLECGARLLRLAAHVFTYHLMTQAQYRERWEYNRTTALCARAESEKVAVEAKRRGWGRRLRPFRFRRGDAHPHTGVARRQEAKRTISEHLSGTSHPEQWKGMATDSLIAQLRLAGKTQEQIAQAVDLNPNSVYWRVKLMRLPARVYDRGAAVTGIQLLNLCSDFQKKREEVSKLLGKHYNWAGDRTRPTKLHHPLSRTMGLAVLILRRALREKQGAPTGAGGRPPRLLRSERAELPGKFQSLHHDLRLLHKFLRDQGGGRGEVWAWLCRMQRKGKMHTLFLWPEFWRWIEKTLGQEAYMVDGAWRPRDIALEFLAEEYGISPSWMDRVAGSPR